MTELIKFAFSTADEPTEFPKIDALLRSKATKGATHVPSEFEYEHTLTISTEDAKSAISFYHAAGYVPDLLRFAQRILDGHIGMFVFGIDDVIRIDREPGSLTGRLRVYKATSRFEQRPMAVQALHIDAEVDLIQFWSALKAAIEDFICMNPNRAQTAPKWYTTEKREEMRQALLDAGLI